MTKIIVAFRDFAKAPNKSRTCRTTLDTIQLLPWRLRKEVPLKYWHRLSNLHGVTRATTKGSKLQTRLLQFFIAWVVKKLSKISE